MSKGYELEINLSHKCPLAIDKNMCGVCNYSEHIRTNDFICHYEDDHDEEMDKL